MTNKTTTNPRGSGRKSKLTPIEKIALYEMSLENHLSKEFVAVRFNVSVRTVDRVLHEVKNAKK